MKPSNQLKGPEEAESPVSAACNAILKSINCCETQLDLLTNRVAPVRIPSAEKTPSDTITANRSGCDLALNLHHMADLINQLTRRMETLISELQV